ncbi:hypothetical protein BC834DRAFT_604478 [Gloeopeniophorella convolvens]|nr:hypothetical protein BC834DRAFT_604478 [Gloeopeniophorella convolvens]
MKAKANGIINEVVVLTRMGSTTNFDGARVVHVNYSDQERLKSALAGVDVAISGISAFALETQLALVDAAKEAGVKLFVPSEFAGSPDNAKGGFYSLKVEQRAKLDAVGMPRVIFYSGIWSDRIWTGFYQWDILSGKIVVGGDGNEQISWTSLADSARFIVHVLTTLPAERLENSVFRCEADKKSFNDLIKLYEDKTGKKSRDRARPSSGLGGTSESSPGRLY